MLSCGYNLGVALGYYKYKLEIRHHHGSRVILCVCGGKSFFLEKFVCARCNQ